MLLVFLSFLFHSYLYPTPSRSFSSLTLRVKQIVWTFHTALLGSQPAWLLTWLPNSGRDSLFEGGSQRMDCGLQGGSSILERVHTNNTTYAIPFSPFLQLGGLPKGACPGDLPKGACPGDLPKGACPGDLPKGAGQAPFPALHVTTTEHVPEF